MTPGDVFGRWTVVDVLTQLAGRARVRCVCGTERFATRTALRFGSSQSCGCLRLDRIKGHGQTGRGLTPEYSAWQSAKARTTNPNSKQWSNYGERGIRMAPEWEHNFEAFFAYLGHKPDPTHSLDRIDNDGDYAPGNVRWADRSTQRRNRRTDHRTRGRVSA